MGAVTLTLVALRAIPGYNNKGFVSAFHHPSASSVMLSRDETAQSVRASTPGRHPRFRRWAVRRARQLSIAVLILAGLLVVAACGVMLKRATCLIGLPDVGDPFDVAAFRAFRVPEDQDAIVFARQAAAKVQRMPDLPMAVRRLGPAVGWSKADPKLRDWATANRNALELFRQGAERADGIANRAVRMGRQLSISESGPARLAGASRGRAAGGARRHGGSLGLVSDCSPYESACDASGVCVAATLRRQQQQRAADAHRQLGRRSEDRHSVASKSPGRRSGRRAKARMGFVLAEGRLSGHDE